MSLLTLISQHKLASAAIASLSGAIVVAGVGIAAADPEPQAVVTHVVDGDTIDVEYDGAEHRVRLLNVDAVEADQCLGTEATDYLLEALPIGSTVTLRFDEEREDRYGRELAGVLLDDTLVNAEIARAGYGVAMLVEPNERYYDDVRAAEEDAEDAGRGIWSTDIACTVPAQVATYAAAARDVESRAAAAVAGSVEDYDGHLAEAAAAVVLRRAVAGILDGDRHAMPLLAYTGDRWSRLETEVRDVDERLERASSTLEEGRAAEVARVEAEKEAEEVTERRAQEEAERRVQEEAERRAQEEAERKAQEEADRKAQEEAERKAQEEADRAAREEAVRRQAEQARRAAAPAAPQQPAPQPAAAYYKNCSAARAAGAAPVYVGQPGYAGNLDRDGDGAGATRRVCRDGRSPRRPGGRRAPRRAGGASSRGCPSR